MLSRDFDWIGRLSPRGGVGGLGSWASKMCRVDGADPAKREKTRPYIRRQSLPLRRMKYGCRRINYGGLCAAAVNPFLRVTLPAPVVRGPELVKTCFGSGAADAGNIADVRILYTSRLRLRDMPIVYTCY